MKTRARETEFYYIKLGIMTKKSTRLLIIMKHKV